MTKEKEQTPEEPQDNQEQEDNTPGGLAALARAAEAEKSPVDKVAPPADGEFDMASLPEQFRKEKPEDTIQAIYGAYQNLRDQRAGQPQPPDASTDYKLTLDDATAKHFPDLEKDKAYGVLRDRAHAAGMSTEVFQDFASGMLGDMVQQGILEAPIDEAAEIQALGGDEKALQRTNTVLTWLDTSKENQLMPPAVYSELSFMAETANGVQALEWAMKGMGERGPALDVPGNPGGYSMEDYRKDVRDPRYDSNSPKYSEDFRRRVDGLLRTIQPG